METHNPASFRFDFQIGCEPTGPPRPDYPREGAGEIKGTEFHRFGGDHRMVDLDLRQTSAERRGEASIVIQDARPRDAHGDIGGVESNFGFCVFTGGNEYTLLDSRLGEINTAIDGKSTRAGLAEAKGTNDAASLNFRVGHRRELDVG